MITSVNLSDYIFFCIDQRKLVKYIYQYNEVNRDITSDPHKPILNLSDKVNLERSNKYVSESNFRIYHTWKI